MNLELTTNRPISSAKLIGIAGLIGSGKDTLANLIVSWKTARRYSFARPLKEGVKAMFGWPDDLIEDRQLKELVDPFWGFSPRKAMQLLGTEYGRDGLRPDIWLLAAARFHQTSIENGQTTLITDVRFENEAEWIRTVPDSVIIHVKNPEQVPPGPDAHISEHGVQSLEGDVIIENDKRKGIENLKDALMRLW